jgi:phage-related protein
MTLDMGTPLITEKNKLYTEHPWIFLFAVHYETGADPWRFAAYPEAVTWDSYTWNAMSAAVELLSLESSGRIADVTVHVSNVALQVSAYQETYDLRGKDVDVYLVNRGCLEETTTYSITAQINSIQRSDTDAIFELGSIDLFLLRLPHIRHIRNHCPYRFRDAKCMYPEDLFGKVTEQDLKVGGDSDKGGGWKTLNIANADIADINRTSPGKLTVKTSATGGPHKFYGTDRDAPQVYKLFKGNFKFYTELWGAVTAESHTGFYVQSNQDLGDWLALMAIEIDGRDQVFVRSSIDGATTQQHVSAIKRVFRIDRTGPVITLSISYAYGGGRLVWEEMYSATRIDLQGVVRVGYVFPTDTAAVGVPQNYEYFKAFSGGALTCDYSFDGTNGCASKMNTPHFGGESGLPHGKITL